MVVNTFNTSPGQAGRSLRSRLARSTWSTYPAKSLPHISRKCKKIKRQLKDGRKEGGKEEMGIEKELEKNESEEKISQPTP